MTKRTAYLTMFALAACAVLAMSTVPAYAAVQDAGRQSSGELVEHPKKYDGKQVSFAGEAIGEAMRRGDNAWLHLNDDAYMLMNVEEGAELGGYNSGMPVWVSANIADRVTTFGDYKHEGDVVQITGKFHAACREHGGDMDIHATDLVVVMQGHPAADPTHPWKIWLALGLTLGAALAWFADRRLSTRELTGWLRGR